MKLETWKPKTKIKLRVPKTKYILAFLVLAVIVLGGLKLGKIINEYIYWQKTKDIYTAALTNYPIDYSGLKPFRNWNIGDLEDVRARAAIVLATGKDGNRIIFEKNASQILPIASLSKIATAYVALKNYGLEQKTTITKRVVDTEEETGQFRIGEKFTVEQLLYSMLVESSNDAARALADIMGEKKFVKLMNAAVEKIHLRHTYFIDPIGLDPDFPDEGYNYSTAKDLALFVQNILQESRNNPKIARIFAITKNNEYVIHLANGREHHRALNTDKLLTEFPNIIGGKTGQTPKAKQCLLIVLPRPKTEDGYLIAIILGSDDRFGEMKRIINWLHKAFVW